MISKLRYKLKKFKIKLYSAIKIDMMSELELKKMPKSKRMKYYTKKFLSKPKKIYLNLTGKEFNVNYVEIVLTTYCSLNCRGCSALMPFYKKREHSKLDDDIKAIDALANSVDSIQKLRLLGGEPLLYPNLKELLECTLSNDKIKNIVIVTNGTLLLKDELIEILKNKKISLFISNYGKTSRKKDELISQLINNNIKYELGSEEVEWRDYGDLECRNRSEKELKEQFSKCEITCSSIYDGKLFYCPRNTHGVNLNKIPLKKEDYIDLFDNLISEKELRKKLYKFFYGYTKYIEACNYCNAGTKNLKRIKAGEQEKK